MRARRSTRAPIQARSKETVRAILDATERVLVREGGKAVTTSRVAKVAGVSVGTLYEYFPTKEALRRAVEERSWTAVLQVISEKVVALRDAPVDEAIAAIVTFSMNVLAERGKVHGFTTDDPKTIESRIALIRQLARVAGAGLVPHRDRVRPHDLPLALEVAIKTVLALTWLGVRDSAADMETGAFQSTVATMITSFLLEDRVEPPPAT